MKRSMFFRQPKPKLVFSPLAWLKLQFLCHRGPTEVGGFGISSADNPLYVEDFQLVRQSCNSVSVRFMDEAVADFFDGCVDQGRMPEQFGRIWCHTHPGASPLPSWTDEETFARCFGSCHWSVMFILSRTSKTYARAAFGILPGFHAEIPVRVDWKAWPEVIDDQDDVERLAGWGQEYDESVDIDPEPPTAMLAKGSDLRNDLQVLAPLDFHLEPF